MSAINPKNAMALLLSRDQDSETYIDIVTYMVFCTVRANTAKQNRITAHVLTSLLCEYFIPEETILACTSSLLRKDAYGVLIRHSTDPDPLSMQLMLSKKSSASFDPWVAAMEEHYPQLQSFEPPLVKRRSEKTIEG
jgi:hypothetical protein